MLAISLCCVAIVTGILAVRQEHRKKRWLAHVAALALMGFNAVTLLLNLDVFSLITD